jgi:RNA recognition motif-containing protein
MNINQQVIVPQKQGDNGRTVLFVSELPENITEQDLNSFFSQFSDSIFMSQINSKFARGADPFHPRSSNATVIFKDHDKADEARRTLNMRRLRGRTVRIMWHERDNNIRYNTQGNLFIKNIPYDVSARQFYEAFLEHGDIISAKLIEDEQGNHNGYGYVSYYENASADKAISSMNSHEVWPGSKLEVARFQKKNERLQNKLSMNKNLYLKNIPENYNENDVKTLFASYGQVAWCKVLKDTNQRKFAIVSMDSEESASKAREGLNNHKVGELTLYVDTLQKKSDRQRILSSKINENNSILNSQFRNCNLYIKNLPEKCTEKNLHEEFSKFGEVKSLKIPKYILVTKVGDQLKEEVVSKCFGYVCFFDQEHAKRAKEEMNGKTLSCFEDSKRPLLIDFFMPNVERKNILMKYQQQFNPNGNKQMPFMNPMSAFGQGSMNMQYGMGQGMPKQGKNTSIYQQQRGPQGARPIPTQPQNFAPIKNDEDPDLTYYNSLEDESAKKEYLGEFIFKKISNHSLNQQKNFTIDVIGKITGMILGIDDLGEIMDICRNHENLTGRITEALSLLNL